MNGQTSEKQLRRDWVRVALVSIVGLLVIGTGVVLIPRDSGAPAAVPFSETARSDAYQDALALKDFAATLAGSPSSGGGAGTWTASVTLLTNHARALLAPADVASASPTSSGTVPANPAAEMFIADLAESGRKRLGDANQADAGIARLLAAVGSAQLLDAERLAGLLKLPAPPDGAVSKETWSSQARTACPSASPTPAPGSATTDAALAAAVRSEQESIYVHQVALKRLDAAAAVTAAKGLATHEQLLQQAENLTRLNCGDVPVREAGYSLPTQFADDPAAALGTLEMGSLPVYGDLVALSTGPSRQWAVETLVAAARRGSAWGAPLPSFPGLVIDAVDLPPLPAPTATRG